jgi:hypothetical protein
VLFGGCVVDDDKIDYKVFGLSVVLAAACLSRNTSLNLMTCVASSVFYVAEDVPRPRSRPGDEGRNGDAGLWFLVVIVSIALGAALVTCLRNLLQRDRFNEYVRVRSDDACVFFVF